MFAIYMTEDDWNPGARTLPPTQASRCKPESPVREATGRPAAQRVSSSDLLKGACQMVIEHEGEEYCLRLTRKRKLILTK